MPMMTDSRMATGTTLLLNDTASSKHKPARILARGSSRWMAEPVGRYWPMVTLRSSSKFSIESASQHICRLLHGQRRWAGGQQARLPQIVHGGRNVRHAQAHVAQLRCLGEHLSRSAAHHGFAVVNHKQPVAHLGQLFHV